MKKNSFFFILILIFVLLVKNSSAESFLKKNTYKIDNKKKINLNNTTYERIEGYLNGNFYSKNLNRNLKNISGIYLAISKNGDNSTISFCDADDFNLCAKQMLAFQTLKKCEKISNQKCFLLFEGKTFLPKREKLVKSIKNYFIVNNKNKAGLHLDIQGKTHEELFDSEN